jgi:hypothetical protein
MGQDVSLYGGSMDEKQALEAIVKAWRRPGDPRVRLDRIGAVIAEYEAAQPKPKPTKAKPA